MFTIDNIVFHPLDKYIKKLSKVKLKLKWIIIILNYQ